ncbi:beta-lactamase-like protein [Schizophyllum amplum]|uniref:hydroxyacylglutathione hydrolase n=1 Tax=Schizophyllum amplum TaxID=97359 RepID=A0A550CD47_9AGAR|nr:beta-lactamase-like protein [Auriculariopsis ampla]
MKVVAVPVRDDNYAYLLIDEPSKKAAAVDPYDVTKVAAAAQGMGVEIVAAITTHHHYDHAGGNKASTYPGVTIYGGSEQVSAVTKIVKDKEEFTIGENTHVKCLATPCHTQDSICYYITDKTGAHPGGVFTGDTLFVGGCGRFFEGTADEMHAALSYLGTLPDKTVVYNGHEYTAGNAAFAKNIDPEGSSVARLVALAKENKLTTGQTTIGDEKEWNVKASGAASGDTTAVMDALRNGKNTFKG